MQVSGQMSHHFHFQMHVTSPECSLLLENWTGYRKSLFKDTGQKCRTFDHTEVWSMRGMKPKEVSSMII